MNLIDNFKLKELGIKMFLKKENSSVVNNKSEAYSKRIKLNKLMRDYDFDQNQHLYVVSASFEDYIKKLFPYHVTVLGSQIEYSKEGIVKGLKFNCYKEKKIEALASKGVTEIDEFYTDSYSDFPVSSISKKIIIVKGDQLLECNTIQEFENYFGK